MLRYNQTHHNADFLRTIRARLADKRAVIIIGKAELKILHRPAKMAWQNHLAIIDGNARR